MISKLLLFFTHNSTLFVVTQIDAARLQSRNSFLRRFAMCSLQETQPTATRVLLFKYKFFGNVNNERVPWRSPARIPGDRKHGLYNKIFIKEIAEEKQYKCSILRSLNHSSHESDMVGYRSMRISTSSRTGQ